MILPTSGGEGNERSGFPCTTWQLGGEASVRDYDIHIESAQIVFIALKLAGDIDWSWWWVLAPLWLVLALKARLLA